MKSSFPTAISERILDEFLGNGQLNPGDKLPTVRYLTERYSPVSSNTVVHALSILERAGWIQRKHGSGCFVAERPVEEISKKVSLIGFVGTCVESKLIFDLQLGIDEVCKQNGSHLIVTAFTNELIDGERAELKRMVDAACDAIILFPAVRNTDQLKDDYLLHEFLDVPIILVDMAYPELKRPRVIFDNRMAGYDMTEYLINKGHKKIAFMSLEKSHPEVINYSISRRYLGYTEAITAHSTECVSGSDWVLAKRSPNDLVRWPDMRESMQERMYDSIKCWKNKPDRATSVIAITDSVACDLIAVANMMGVDVPNDLTVVGFDNFAHSALSYPTFTTTSPDFRKMGGIAARMFLQTEENTINENTTYILPVPLLERKQPIIAEIDRL